MPIFRAYHKELKIMHPVVGLYHMDNPGSELVEVRVAPFLDHSGMYFREKLFWKLSDIVLMQSLGFKDKNHKDVYVNDIVKVLDIFVNDDEELPFYTGEIFYHKAAGNTVITSYKLEYSEDYSRIMMEGVDIEVIGNRWENHSLLEEQ